MQGTFSLVCCCPSNGKSNVRSKMCIHMTSNTADGAIQDVHAVEETHLATVESTLQQVHRVTHVLSPATARPRKNYKGQHTNGVGDTWKASSRVGMQLEHLTTGETTQTNRGKRL